MIPKTTPLRFAPGRYASKTARVIALVAFITALGCSSGDLPLAEVDPHAVPDTSTYEQIYSIIQRECLPCHDEGGEDPPYDTCDHVVANFGDLFEQVFEKNRMPPGAWPRLSSEDKLTLLRWNGKAPCTP